MANPSKDFLEKTIQTWQPYSNKTLTLDDALEIAENTIKLYAYLIELKAKHDQKETKV
jgi:hypothetical protein